MFQVYLGFFLKVKCGIILFFFFSSRSRHTRLTCDWSSDVCSSDLTGDTVLIEESRPLSATKRWRLIEVVTRAGEQAGEQILAEEAATEEAIHGAAHPGRHQAGAEARPEASASDAEADAGPADGGAPNAAADESKPVPAERQ